MLLVQHADLDAVVSFLKSNLLGDQRTSATHACVLMLLPLQVPPPVISLTGALDPSALPPGLTARESSVLQAVVNGRTNAQIARELNTTVGSIKGTVQSLFRKLGVSVKRRSALVRAAMGGTSSNPVCEPARPALAALTPVESTILQGIAQRQTNRDIALRLQIPELAVKAAIRCICGKLGTNNRSQLRAYFMHAGESLAANERE
jgi:DNA-binding NarL/FixJ family response regulator